MLSSYQNTQNYANEMINFEVGTGDSKIIFKVHREPACQHSPRINDDFGDGKWATLPKSTSYKLTDVDSKTFRLFHLYIYSRKITLPFHNVYPRDDTEPTDSPDHGKRCAKLAETLVKLWVLADHFLISDLQNHVVDNIMLFQACTWITDWTFEYVYENTKPGSALRRLMVDLCCWVPETDVLQ
jgi:hypothetical protein